jgi:RES domain-containing protein
VFVCTSFSGLGHRILAVKYYRTAFSPKGSRLKAGRFNRTGFRAVYLALDLETAFAEYHRGGLPRPAVMVAAQIEADNIIDICGDLSALPPDWQDWQCDWEIARDEYEAGRPADCSSWRCGDDAIARGCCGIMFPSAQRPGGRNLALFPEDATAGSLTLSIIDPNREILGAHPPRLTP